MGDTQPAHALEDLRKRARTARRRVQDGEDGCGKARRQRRDDLPQGLDAARRGADHDDVAMGHELTSSVRAGASRPRGSLNSA
jgi:hypothetical protein